MFKASHGRREFVKAVFAAFAATQLVRTPTARASSESSEGLASRLAPSRQIRAGVLDVGYFEAGPSDGPPVFLLHGFPYSVESYWEVAPLLAARGCRVIVPHLRGHGSTRFLDASTPRTGQQGAIGVDVIALMDALRVERAVLAGYDWGGRAACVAAALWPERCAGLVSANGYLIQAIARAGPSLATEEDANLWYQVHFQTERGIATLTANRRQLARTFWARNSPTWKFDEATLDRHTRAFDNPDYVDVVFQAYRHRMGLSDGYAEYADVEQRLATLPAIVVPAITLDGKADGAVPPTDGRSSAAKFPLLRAHRVITGAGHNLPEEAPIEFAEAVLQLAGVRHGR
jgi:pimeloyl-ACP methyl ester carboxylesterase